MSSGLQNLLKINTRQGVRGRAPKKKNPVRVAALLTVATVFAALLIPGIAFAARGHVFSGKEIGGPGKGPGQFEGPAGVAVNESTGQPASGDLYVVDTGNGRVQRLSSAGVFQSEIKGPSGEGSGALTAESKTITSVLETVTAGRFTVGEEIEGEGIPAETTITGVPGGAVLEISNAVEVGKGGPSVKLKAHQSFSFPSAAAETSGVAVDDSCFLGKSAKEQTECEATDPSAGDVYVLDVGHSVVDKFTAAGVYLGQLSESEGTRFEELDGVAVDGKGELWVAEHEAGSRSSEAGPFVNSFSDALVNESTGGRVLKQASGHAEFSFGAPGFAVDSKDDLYAAVDVNAAPVEVRLAKFASSGELIVNPVDSEEPSGVAVEMSTGEVYVDNVGSVARFSATAAEGAEPVERLGAEPGRLKQGTGVAVSSAGEAVYVSDAGSDVVEVYAAEEPSLPTVEKQSVADVSAEGATFEAAVNPHGAATEAYFEYGRCVTPSTCAASPFEYKTEPVSVGAQFAVATVGPTHVQGLSPGVAYHYRLVATNGNGTVKGEPGEHGGEVLRSFTTQGPGGALVLPDGRRWEMVSLPEKRGQELRPLDLAVGMAIQAAANGDALAYLASGSTEAAPAGEAVETQLLATRNQSAGGWETKDISLPHVAHTSILLNGGFEYRAFSADLSTAVVQPFGPFITCEGAGGLAQPCLSPAASEQTPFLRSETGEHAGAFTPLVSGCPGGGKPCPVPIVEHTDVPPGTVFGQEAHGGPDVRGCPPEVICGPFFEGATPDLAHVVLLSRANLAGVETAGAEELYEWSAGAPAGSVLPLVSVLPESGGPAPEASLGDRTGDDARGAISGDGSRVFWSTDSRLYMTDLSSGTPRSAALDEHEGACGACESGGGQFQAANAEGSRVFFTDNRKLTANSGASFSPRDVSDLYECEILVSSAGTPECRLSDLTPPNGGEPASVQGSVVGASEDGSYVYFVADGKLAPGAAKGNCSGASSPPGSTCNLYLRHEGVTSLVAVLSGDDAPDWVPGGGLGLTRVSPDGRWLAFMSDRDLTGYDTRDARTGRPAEEAYLYHAPQNLEKESGTLTCVSCDPTGARPIGVEYNTLTGTHAGLLRGALGTWEHSSMLAADLPGWEDYYVGHARYQPRYLSDSGRLFFDTPQALVPQDGNGTWDVYEYEPEGIASPEGKVLCDRESPGFSERSAGCIGLISSGQSKEESAFLDASESGGDVFFLTSARLSPQDTDSALDVYDARECTAAAACFAPVGERPPPCSEPESCRGAPTPQPGIFGAPASATFSGPGNLTPSKTVVPPKKAAPKCRKGFVRRTVKHKSMCVRVKHKKTSHKHSKK